MSELIDRRVGNGAFAVAHALTSTRARTGAKWLVAILPTLLVTAAYADGDATRGETRFIECAACHSVEPGSNNVGPSLAGIFDRKAGALTDFRYSAAMRRSGITWTPLELEAFIADPQQRVPANRMPYAGLPDAAARADLIAYLQKVAK